MYIFTWLHCVIQTPLICLHTFHLWNTAGIRGRPSQVPLILFIFAFSLRPPSFAICRCSSRRHVSIRPPLISCCRLSIKHVREVQPTPQRVPSSSSNRKVQRLTAAFRFHLLQALLLVKRPFRWHNNWSLKWIIDDINPQMCSVSVMLLSDTMVKDLHNFMQFYNLVWTYFSGMWLLLIFCEFNHVDRCFCDILSPIMLISITH